MSRPLTARGMSQILDRIPEIVGVHLATVGEDLKLKIKRSSVLWCYCSLLGHRHMIRILTGNCGRRHDYTYRSMSG
jgi:hypothetical protein